MILTVQEHVKIMYVSIAEETIQGVLLESIVILPILVLTREQKVRHVLLPKNAQTTFVHKAHIRMMLDRLQAREL